MVAFTLGGWISPFPADWEVLLLLLGAELLALPTYKKNLSFQALWDEGRSFTMSFPFSLLENYHHPLEFGDSSNYKCAGRP